MMALKLLCPWESWLVQETHTQAWLRELLAALSHSGFHRHYNHRKWFAIGGNTYPKIRKRRRFYGVDIAFRRGGERFNLKTDRNQLRTA
jgi:hypothetical protein